MSSLKYTFALVVFAVVACSVRAWDLGVITQTQIQFLLKNEVEKTAADQLKNMIAAAYNPITNDIYVSDSNQKVGSIFRIKTTGEEAYTSVEPIVANQSATVQGMAFDYHTSTLYWTTGNDLTINYVQVPENKTKVPLRGNVLLTFKEEIPQGIAIDTCRGYLYWTNCNHLNATIERSRLDGTDRQVIVHEHLFQPLGIAVDGERNRLYWSDEREGIYYSIDSSDLNGDSRKRLIHGTRHQPFAIALDDQKVYWSDWVNNVVWSMPKDSFMSGVQPQQVTKFSKNSSPMGLITPSGNTTLINETYCAMNRAKDVVLLTEATPELISYKFLKNICKNNGILHVNGSCTCAPGFEGEFCNIGVCDGYCVTGTCIIDKDGQKMCQCPITSYGKRCENQVCSGKCQNGGNCVLDSAGNPRCECMAGYTGDSCQFEQAFLNELCSFYCQNVLSKSQQSSVCRCEDYGNRQFEYSKLSILDHSEISSCKLSKTMQALVVILAMFVISLGTFVVVLSRKVRSLGRRPRIKKRIVVNKSITPLTCRPQEQQQNQQCEITIENCCNMNICETPCFEPDFRPSKLEGLIPSLGRSKKEDKTNLLSNTDMSSEDEKPPY